MMKLTLSLTLIWMISSTAEALQCLNSNIHSSGVLQPCHSADEVCATTAMQDFQAKPQMGKTIIRSCVPSFLCTARSQIFSFSDAVRKVAANIHCCNTNGCNSQNVTYPDVQKTNGLQCVSCNDPQGIVCNKTVQCVGVQDRCINAKVTAESQTVQIRGCVSANVCEVVSQLTGQTVFTGDNFTSTARCCGTSFCNSAWTVKLSVVLVLFGLIALIVC